MSTPASPSRGPPGLRLPSRPVARTAGRVDLAVAGAGDKDAIAGDGRTAAPPSSGPMAFAELPEFAALVTVFASSRRPPGR